MSKKYAIKVMFPDEDKWVYVLQRPTLLHPEEHVMTFYNYNRAVEYIKEHELVDIAMIVFVIQEHETWYEID